MEKPGYFAILPAAVRYDNRLKPAEKIFYAEITSLTEMEGYCYASNAYFCQLYQVSERTVQRWCSHLQALGYIRVEAPGAGEDAHPRRIWPMQAVPARLAAQGGDKNVAGGDKIVGEGVTKMSPPTSKEQNINTNTGACAHARGAEPEEGAGKAAEPLPDETPQERDVRETFAAFADGDKQLLGALEDFAAHRKEGKKKPLTKLAAKRLVAKLRSLARDAGEEAHIGDAAGYMCAALDQSILNGWTDVYAVREYRPAPPPARPAAAEPDRPRVIPADADAADLF